MPKTGCARFTAADGSLVALVDCDSFFASCEQVARPDLQGKPVVVLSNNDGCIVARNKEAKALHIPMGIPEFQARPVLEKNQVAVFSSNYTLYGDLSSRVMQTIASVVPKIEIYSIDEAFALLDKGLAVQALDVAQEIRSRVARWVGLPVCVGIAPTKVLAKIATHVAKKYPGYHGIFDLSACGCVNDVLESVPVADIWGIGRKSALKLAAADIYTARQLRDADPTMIRHLLTVNGLNIVMELRGLPSIAEDIPATHITIISSRSLGYKVTTLEPLEEAVAFHAARAAEKLRKKKLLTGMVSVGIKTAHYAKDQPQHDEMTWVRLANPTMDSAAIIRAAQNGLKRIFRHGYGYAKVMVMLTDLRDPQNCQLNLLEECADNPRRQKLMALLDEINRRQGRGTLRFAAQGAIDASWHMNRNKLSPAWTTDWQQLLRVGGVKLQKI